MLKPNRQQTCHPLGRGAERGLSPGVLGPTCLQESSTGCAQEHDCVVVDTGHCHGSQAAVGEDGGGCDRVHDGQGVLKVCSSTVQLLRLQLGRDTNISRQHKQQWVPLPPPLRSSGDRLLRAPLGRAPELSHRTGKCKWPWAMS